MNLTHLSNEELLAGAHALVGQGRAVLARLLAYLGEVEERRLDLESACSSLFDFCLRRLGMSDHEACRRVAAARLVRRFPVALGMLERGEIHLTGLLLLREHLTPERGEELLRAASGKSKGELQHLLAQLFPRPDVPSRIQVLPVSATRSPQSLGRPPGQPGAAFTGPPFQVSRIEPLAPARYRVEFTGRAELRTKLERAADLMRHAHPSGELSVIVERAVDLLLAELEKRRLAKVTRARRGPAGKSTRSGVVPRAVRREVFERDGERCTFVDPSGRRCESRTLLELDHRVPRARGGPDDAANLSVKCSAHNRLLAEKHFGREHIEEKKGKRGRFGAGAMGVDEADKGGSGGRAMRDAEAVQGGLGGRAMSDAEAVDFRFEARSMGDDAPAESRIGGPPAREMPAEKVHPRQSGFDGHEIAVRALCAMGFKAQQARRALGIVAQRRSSPPPSIEALLREALTVLA